jgi:hypothetical protein
VPLREEDRAKTAFSTQDGHFEFCTMPTGVTRATSTFARMMHNIMSGLIGTKALGYLDDIVVYGATLQDHNDDIVVYGATLQEHSDDIVVYGATLQEHNDDIVVYGATLQDHNDKWTEVFCRLRLHSLRLQPDKCEFFRKEVCYLGHKIMPDRG